MRVIRSKDFTATRAWGADEIANMLALKRQNRLLVHSANFLASRLLHLENFPTGIVGTRFTDSACLKGINL